MDVSNRDKLVTINCLYRFFIYHNDLKCINQSTPAVLDPRLKLAYYKEHKWEQKWFDMANKVLSKTYKEYYAPRVRDSSSSSDEEEDELSIHLYKRRRVENRDELEEYLGSDIAHHKTDPLQWWKVQLFKSKLYFRYV